MQTESNDNGHILIWLMAAAIFGLVMFILGNWYGISEKRYPADICNQTIVDEKLNIINENVGGIIEDIASVKNRDVCPTPQKCPDCICQNLPISTKPVDPVCDWEAEQPKGCQIGLRAFSSCNSDEYAKIYNSSLMGGDARPGCVCVKRKCI